MRILSNSHTHSVFCDGKDTVAHMAETACHLGFVSLGFSGHSPYAADREWCIRNLEAYRAEVKRVQAEYAGKMRIWLGLEWDYIADIHPADFEYTIGDTHRVYTEKGQIPVDHSRVLLENLVDNYLHGDYVELYRLYYDSVKEACRQKSPIFGHFDLVRKFNDEDRYFTTASQDYRARALDALECVFRSGAVLEINTGSMWHGKNVTPYPDPFLLDAWHEMGGDIIINSDCHNAVYLENHFPLAIQRARDAGFTHALRLGVGSQLFEAVDLQ